MKVSIMCLCGLHLLLQAKTFPGAQVRGITLSPFQRGRAEALTAKAGLADQAQFQV